MEKLNIFADYHHNDLYQFLKILFEKRLKYNLYRPIGLEWFYNKIWLYSKNLPTVRQYLDPLNNVESKDGIYYIHDSWHNDIDKCITFDKFKEMKIDIIIDSVFEHQISFSALAKSHWNKPKFIRVIGNINEPIDFNYSKNIIVTAQPMSIPNGINAVFCHQEFDLKSFQYKSPTIRNSIKNFVNCLPFTKDFPLWKQYKTLLPDFDWKMHGGQGEDGGMKNMKELSAAFSDSSFIWHVKSGGDGFGHNIHSAYACGRPPIVKGSYYAGQLALPLMIDGKTCIDLEKHTIEENIRLIKEFSQTDKHNQMCENVHKRFCEIVDYESEFIKLREFFGNLI